MDHIRGSESAEGSIHGVRLAFRFANFVRSHAEIKALISWQPAAAPNWHRRRRRRRTFVRSFARSLARTADCLPMRSKEERARDTAHHINS